MTYVRHPDTGGGAAAPGRIGVSSYSHDHHVRRIARIVTLEVGKPLELDVYPERTPRMEWWRSTIVREIRELEAEDRAC